MSSPFRTYGEGELLDSEDLNQDNQAVRALVGGALTAIFAAYGGNAMPTTSGTTGGPGPLLVIPAAAGLGVVVGGPNQSVFVTGQLATYCPSQIFVTPSNTSGSNRTDSIAIQFSNPTVNPQTRAIEAPDTTITTSNIVYSVLESVNYAYVTGSTTPPAGYVAYATILVPSGATSIIAGNIVYLFPTMVSLIASAIGVSSLMTSLNLQTGAVNITAGTGVAITIPTSGVVQVANAGVTALQSLIGSVNIGSSDGSIGVATSGNTIELTANGLVTSVNGEHGALSIVNGPGVTITTPAGNQIEVTNVGVLSVNGQVGALAVANGAGIALNVIGNLFSFSNTGVLSINGGTGALTVAGVNIGVALSGGILTLTNTGVISLNNAGPFISIISGPGVNVTTAGGLITISNTGVTGVAGQTGSLGLYSPLSTMDLTGSAGGFLHSDAVNPIGGRRRAQGRVTGSGVTLSLGVLPVGTWSLYARAYADVGSGSMTLTGGGASWESSSTSPDTAAAEMVELIGTATSGQTPTVTLTYGGTVTGYAGIFFIEAWRVS